MSLGKFNYKQMYIKEIYEELKEERSRIINEENDNQLLEEVNLTLYYLDRAYAHVQAIDAILSGDIVMKDFEKAIIQNDINNGK